MGLWKPLGRIPLLSLVLALLPIFGGAENVTGMPPCYVNGTKYNPTSLIFSGDYYYVCWRGEPKFAGLRYGRIFPVTARNNVTEWGLTVGYNPMILRFDNIAFYWNGNHSVARLPDARAFEQCDLSNATLIAQSFVKGCSTYEHCLPRYQQRGFPPGASSVSYYFTSLSGNDCQNGVKINVTYINAPCIYENKTYAQQQRRCQDGDNYVCIFDGWRPDSFCTNCTFDNRTYPANATRCDINKSGAILSVSSPTDFFCNGTRNVSGFGVWVPTTTCECELGRKLFSFLDNANCRRLDLEWDPTVPVCTWPGITCSNATTVTSSECAILKVNISSVGCRGTLKFSALPSTVETLDVSDNSFEGTVDFSTFPSSLLHLNLGHNAFEGDVNLNRLPHKLRSIDLSYNLFSGALPPFEELPPSILVVQLSRNFFSGVLNLRNLPVNITAVDVSSNDLSYLLVNNNTFRYTLVELFLYDNPWICPLPPLPSWVELGSPPCIELGCTLNETKYTNGESFCLHGARYLCRNGSLHIIGECKRPCVLNGQSHPSGQTFCANRSLYLCNDTDLKILGPCELSCTLNNTNYTHGEVFCSHGAKYRCFNGTLVIIGICVRPCVVYGHSYPSGQTFCHNGTEYECNDTDLFEVGLCEQPCFLNDTFYQSGSTLCFDSILYLCNNTELSIVGICEQNCTIEGQTIENGGYLCSKTSHIRYRCDNGTAVDVGHCVTSGYCMFNEFFFLVGDFVCSEDGVNYECQATDHLVAVGSCVPVETVLCSRWDVPCSTTTVGVETVVYCGLPGKLSTATSLCYYDAEEHWCDNNRLGSGKNWIMRAAFTTRFGFPCNTLLSGS